MKIIDHFAVALSISFISISVVADIPYLPPDRVQACARKKAGDPCTEGRSNIRNGICVMDADVLICTEQTEKALMNMANPNNGKDPADNAKAPNAGPPSDTNAKNAEENADDSAAGGCSNSPIFPGGMVSLVSVILGLLMMKRIRRS